MGETTRAKADYDKADRLSREIPADADAAAGSEEQSPAETQQTVAARFTTLLTVDDNAKVKEEYHTQGIKGRVQDRTISIDIEPMFSLSYYVTNTELRETPYYIKEVDDLNASRLLRFGLMVTNREPRLDDEEDIQRHFKSVAYYDSYMSTHTPRAIDYFARAMDHYTLRNFDQAIADLDQAIALTPDFTLAYLARAAARHQLAESMGADATVNVTSEQRRVVSRAIRDDIERVIELSPRMALAYYNLGNLMVETGDMTSALTAYGKAIELKPDLGEAYYNRGYVYFRLGNKEAGVADLSKAGELGIVPSYNLLKRMSR
ncbi:MAG: tetratricopeptide repeat protein, partial [Muribaculum sp.]|nr:tetratricopeptide repeat protein [Muribaculum sp.]